VRPVRILVLGESKIYALYWIPYGLTHCHSGNGNTPDTLKACNVRFNRIYGEFAAQQRFLTPRDESPWDFSDCDLLKIQNKTKT
jgi:hypothetical protein